VWTWRGLDLVGALLCGRPGIAGITFWAVGTGDPAWGDADPPPVDPATIELTAEIARGRLRPTDLSVNADTGILMVTITVPAAAQPLRELALFGGRASPRPGSGEIVSLQRHPPVTVDGALTRTVALSPPAGLLPGARQLILELLAGPVTPAAGRINWLAVGTGLRTGEPPPPGLGAESSRSPLGAADVVYDEDQRQVVATTAFAYDQAPGALTEAGLFAGPEAGASPGSGTLVAYYSHAVIDRTQPTELTERLVLSLSTDDAVAVPDLTGKLLADAQSALVAAELTVGTTTQSTDDEHPRGSVLTQEPVAASPAHPGWQVNLTLSIPTQVVVPPLVGALGAAVASLLAPVGLVVDEANSTTQESAAPAGTVLRTMPAAGTTVDKGSAVVLVTAIALTAPVPDLRGQTPDAAQALLVGSGLMLSPAPYATTESDLTTGTILSQTPDPGQRAPLGSTITPVLATGWTVPVPDVTGITADDAGARLAAAGGAVLSRLGRPDLPLGLNLGARTGQESTSVPGTILTQFPAAGETASLYGVVDVVFATTPTDVVPDVTGRSQADAAAAITGAGLTVGVISARMRGDPTDPHDQTVAGTVLEQQPLATTRWPTGGAVSLTVATPLAAAVPNVIELPLDVAKETLLGRTFTVGAVTSQAEGGKPGSITTQDPPAGIVLPLGSGIALTVVVGVPSLIGLTQDDARAVLDPLGLKLGSIASQPSSAPLGTILGQDPTAGSAADAATVVNVTLAAPIEVTVPNFTQLTIDAAQATATSAGLVVSVGGTAPSASAPGTIVSQDPIAGTLVPPGATVTVTTAVPTPVQQTVPNLQGMDQGTATQAVSALGLVLAVTAQQPSDQAALTVVSQTPAAGSLVAPGTVVDVVVASPPDANTVLVPDVRGMASDAASAAITAAGLIVTVLSQPSTATPGTVLSQSPLAGGRVPTGSAVSITVAAVIMTTVPDVTDFSQAAASAAITGAHLVPRFLSVGVAVLGVGGLGLRIVVAQRPAGGTSVPTGSIVMLTLGTSGISPPILRPLGSLPPRLIQ
jgi:beta-lactam-binding protein with PASTA domain